MERIRKCIFNINTQRTHAISYLLKKEQITFHVDGELYEEFVGYIRGNITRNVEYFADNPFAKYEPLTNNLTIYFPYDAPYKVRLHMVTWIVDFLVLNPEALEPARVEHYN